MSDYPDIHPRAVEIKAAKQEIEELYVDLATFEESARQHYRFAMEQLKGMGDDHKDIHGTLKRIAKRLNDLKGMIDSPLL